MAMLNSACCLKLMNIDILLVNYGSMILPTSLRLEIYINFHKTTQLPQDD